VSLVRALLVGIPGGWEWLVILLVVLIFFGNRIPGMARALGSGISEFKSGLKEGEAEGKRLEEERKSGSQDEGSKSGDGR
jgi:sec-independent protein translocase protein TatA